MEKTLNEEKGFKNLHSIQALIDRFLLPATLATPGDKRFEGENWQAILHWIDQELSNFKALGSMGRMRKIDMTGTAQCPECGYQFPVDLCSPNKNIIS